MPLKLSEFNYDGRRMGYGRDLTAKNGVVVARVFDAHLADSIQFLPEMGQIAGYAAEFFGALHDGGNMETILDQMPYPARVALGRMGQYLQIISRDGQCDEPKFHDQSSPETSEESAKPPCCETAVCTLGTSASPTRKKRGSSSRRCASRPRTSGTGCQS